MFQGGDLEDYFSRFINISNDAKKRVQYFCGGHPYILNILGWNIIDNLSSCHTQVTPDIVEKAAARINSQIIKYYNDLVKLLRDQLDAFDRLLGILFDGSCPDREDELVNYGLIERTSEGTWRAFSDHFHEYLEQEWNKAQQRSVVEKESHFSPKETSNAAEHNSVLDSFDDGADELRNQWARVERALRTVIKVTMKSELTDDWATKLDAWKPFTSISDDSQNFNKIFSNAAKNENNLKTLQDKDYLQQPDSLVEGTQPRDLFDIILHDALWPHFKQIFCPSSEGNTAQLWDRKRWITVGKAISECRVLTHHSHGDRIDANDKDILTSYFKQIDSVLSQWNDIANPQTSPQQTSGNVSNPCVPATRPTHGN